MCSTRSRRRSEPRHRRSRSSRPSSKRRSREVAIPPSSSTHRSMPTPAPARRPRTPRPAPAASRSCSIRWIDASPTPSSTARTADLVSRSSPRCRTTERTRRCDGSTMCPDCRSDYEDPDGPPLPRGADRVSDVRTPAAARGSGGRSDRGRSGRARRGAAAGGLDRRRERARRVPARVRCARRSRRPRAPHTETPAGQAVRGHGPRHGRGSPTLRSVRGRGGGARVVARPDRLGGRSRNPRAGGRPRSPTARRDASLDAGRIISSCGPRGSRSS